MNKKGQSISINTIIIAAIALAVLVVLFVIFTGRIGIFSKGVGETASCENACKAIGMTRGDTSSKLLCDEDKTRKYIPGTYSDIGTPYCCCSP
ncbi:hypothetical protein HYW99_01265 [Candidatus Woesearchaeota archaeon]|nr:hypothetical protein [Candidatus Woesearchaeota archaeon]